RGAGGRGGGAEGVGGGASGRRAGEGRAGGVWGGADADGPPVVRDVAGLLFHFLAAGPRRGLEVPGAGRRTRRPGGSWPRVRAGPGRCSGTAIASGGGPGSCPGNGGGRPGSPGRGDGGARAGGVRGPPGRGRKRDGTDRAAIAPRGRRASDEGLPRWGVPGGAAGP